MKSILAFALATAFAAGASTVLADTGCKAPSPDAKEDHSHCGSMSAGHAHGAVYRAIGLVKSVDMGAGKVTIAHEPIADLKWPAMTMRFGVSDRKLLAELSAGKKIDFRFVQRGDEYLVTALY